MFRKGPVDATRALVVLKEAMITVTDKKRRGGKENKGK